MNKISTCANSSSWKLLWQSSQRNPLNSVKLWVETARSGLYAGIRFCKPVKSSVNSKIGFSTSIWRGSSKSGSMSISFSTIMSPSSPPVLFWVPQLTSSNAQVSGDGQPTPFWSGTLVAGITVWMQVTLKTLMTLWPIMNQNLAINFIS